MPQHYRFITFNRVRGASYAASVLASKQDDPLYLSVESSEEMPGRKMKHKVSFLPGLWHSCRQRFEGV